MVTNNNRNKRSLDKGSSNSFLPSPVHVHHHVHEHVQLEPAKETFRHANFVKPSGSHYIYTRAGSFDIVWPNAIVYAVACLLHVYAIWLVFHPSNWSITNAYSLMTCKSFLPSLVFLCLSCQQMEGSTSLGASSCLLSAFFSRE